MARMKLTSVALVAGLYQDPVQPTAKVLDLVEDLSASVYFCLSHRASGMTPIARLEDVAGAKAYALISPLGVAGQCVEMVAAHEEASERMTWISHVLKVMQEKLGISEAWCWREGQNKIGKASVERELAFDSRCVP